MGVLFVSLIIVVVDQVTKFLVKGGTIPLLNIKVAGMNYGESINVIGNFFKITYVENPGMAFGIDVGNTSKLFLSLFSLAASIGILFYLYKVRDQKLSLRISLAFIFGGAVGNLIDRVFYGVLYGYAPVFYGKVVDFFNVDFFDFTLFGHTYERWPIFNIADASVTIGVVLLIIFYKNYSVQKEATAETQITPKNVSLNSEIKDTMQATDDTNLVTPTVSTDNVKDNN
ncbi:signal peptidase II [Melioribacteraceae bacterium 4301-Me]|uniref:signal peptidase II n=1 Tax=Pyranulibacter aquaticus TaxID=3163344 RepID=UPI00359B9104